MPLRYRENWSPKPKIAAMATNNSVSTNGMGVQHLSPVHRLPTELLYEIVPYLTTLEVRLLGRVNRPLHCFVARYLTLKRYNATLFRLPQDVLENIAGWLPSKRDRGRFAQASQRLYPILMEHMIRLAIEEGENSFLCSAAKRNDIDLAKKVLRLGGDVNGADSRWCFEYWYCINGTLESPLHVAAYYGHESMVRMLSEAGASQFVDGKRRPLLAAIWQGHDEVARILTKDVRQEEFRCIPVGETKNFWEWILYMTCQAGLVPLARELLDRGQAEQTHEQRVESRTIVLLGILHNAAHRCYPDSDDDDLDPHDPDSEDPENIKWDPTGIVKSKLFENVFAIMLLLLEYGADPDMEISWEYDPGVSSEEHDEFYPPGTIRSWAARSPGPRMRNLLPKKEGRELAVLPRSPAQIGHSMTLPKWVTDWAKCEPSLHDDECSASLWDFIEAPIGTQVSSDPEEQVKASSSPQKSLNASSTTQDVLQQKVPSVQVRSSASEEAVLFWSKPSRNGFGDGKRVDRWGREF